MKIDIHEGNWEPNRGMKLEGVVIHIMQGTLPGTDSHFQTKGTFVSSQDGIGKLGELHEYVDYGDKAYHAGRVSQPTWEHIKKTLWGSFINPNKYTYGIECEGYRGDRWTEFQMETIVDRTRKALDRANLPYKRERIISHNEIAIDKEDMSLWCDEIVRQLNQPVQLPGNKVDKARELLEEAVILLK